MVTGSELTIAALIGAGVLALVLAALWWRDHQANVRERERMRRTEASGLHLPASLHPVINPAVCIGSRACVAACPEGDVIGVVDGAGRLIHGAACIGHGRCATECPVDAIHLVFGTSERGVDIPFLTPTFETSRPGVYIAGELGGMGLIRNAVRQGVGAGRDAIARLSPTKNRPDGAVDLLVVGAGPAGLGAGLAAVEAGVSYRVIEQDTVGGSVAHYPRQKVVMTEPVEVPLFGRIHQAEISKEELLELWNELILETRLDIQTGCRLEGIEGEEDAFDVTTSTGTIRASKVILAVGRRGTPRRLDVLGEGSPQVTYSLTDPQQYTGRDILVVGGGDSALEAAAALCDESDARVRLCYRGDSFYRAKAKNRERVEQLEAADRLQILLRTNVASLDGRAALLRAATGERRVPADHVIAALGGTPPTALLERIGVRTDRWYGAPPEADMESTRIRVGNRPKTGLGMIGMLLGLTGLVTVVSLAWVGRAYYGLAPAAREASELHDRLRPSGSLGHGIGILATAAMLTNFLYAARKRLRFMRRLGGTRRWLNVHVLVGALTPITIGFHAAFRANNLVAGVTYGAVASVLVTGIVGRWVYGRVAAGNGFDNGRGAFKRFLRGWRAVHVVLAVVMVITIVIHVGVSWMLGYRWFF